MAKSLAKDKPVQHDGVCFHSQQSAEKYLKAFLQECGVRVPRTHDLVKLLELIIPVDGPVVGVSRGARFLTIFAVDFRYPDKDATARQSRSAIQWAERFRTEIRKRLKLKP